MYDGLLNAALTIVAGLALYRFYPAIRAALIRFDARNRARIEDEIADKSDALAHFRHTLKIAGEQVEAVSEITLTDVKTATPVTCYVFEGQRFATRQEADAARAEKVRIKAREFYRELPIALSQRRDDGKLH